MNVPESIIDHRVFINTAIAQGIKITSRLPGVSLSKRNGVLEWKSSLYHKGKWIYTKYFPLTPMGERSAHLVYLEAHKELGIEVRYAAKKKWTSPSSNQEKQ